MVQLTNNSHLFFHLQTGSTKRLLEIAAYLVGEHQLWKDLGLLCIRAAICFNIAPRPTEILRICQAWSKDRTQQPTPKVFFVIQYYLCIYIYIYLYMYISIINCKLYTIYIVLYMSYMWWILCDIIYLQSKSQGWESEKESSASPLLNDPDTFSKSPPVLVPTSYFAFFPPNWPNDSPLAYPCLNWRILWNLRTHSSLAIWIRNARAATAHGATILADEKAIHLTEMKA